MSDWISVKDRLPTKETYLILYDEKNGCAPGYYEDQWWTYFFYGNECNARAENVTHWMPLPTPPKE